MSALALEKDRFTELDNGFWWPKSDVRGRIAIMGEVVSAVAWLLSHVEGRNCIVQAGANVGVYPVALSKMFDTVITVEPDPVNYGCLTRNLADHLDDAANVVSRRAAFGVGFGKTCHMVVDEADNCGAHRVMPGGGIPILPIDHLVEGLRVDAIWLDIEGSELEALEGAVETIKRCSPVIAFEDKGHGPSPAYWLEHIGYSLVSRHGNDKLYKRQT